MKKFLCMIATALIACSEPTQMNRSNFNAPTIEERTAAVVAEMNKGNISQEEAVDWLDLRRDFEAAHQRFFPRTWTFTIVNPHPADETNCADPCPGCPTIDCFWNENPWTKCTLVIRVTGGAPVDLLGTWVFTKECDGTPIGEWGETGLLVFYDTFVHY